MWLLVEGMDLPAQAPIGPRRTRAFTTSLTSLELGLFGLCTGVGDGVGEGLGKEDVLLFLISLLQINADCSALSYFARTIIAHQRLAAFLSSGTFGAFTRSSISSRLKNNRLFT